MLQFSVVMKSSSIYQGKIAQTTNVPCHIFRLTVVWCDDVPAFDEHEQLCRTTVRTEHSVVSDSLHLTNISNIHTYTHTWYGAPQYNDSLSFTLPKRRMSMLKRIERQRRIHNKCLIVFFSLSLYNSSSSM